MQVLNLPFSKLLFALLLILKCRQINKFFIFALLFSGLKLGFNSFFDFVSILTNLKMGSHFFIIIFNFIQLCPQNLRLKLSFFSFYSLFIFSFYSLLFLDLMFLYIIFDSLHNYNLIKFWLSFQWLIRVMLQLYSLSHTVQLKHLMPLIHMIDFIISKRLCQLILFRFLE